MSIFAFCLFILFHSPQALKRSKPRLWKTYQLIYPTTNCFRHHAYFRRIVIGGTNRVPYLLVTQARQEIPQPLRILKRDVLKKPAILSAVAKRHAVAFYFINEAGLSI